MSAETTPGPAAIQAGMSNDDLMAAWMRKLPGRAPQGQELSAFALGVEVGAERYAETWDALQFAVKNYMDMSSKKDRATAAVYHFHYAMKDAGWHPGRTDDDMGDVIRAKGKEMQELRARLEDALETLRMVDDNNRVDAGEDRKAWRGDFVESEVRRVLGA
jgi:hypothetical protein